jgi:hypothetical protein
MEYRSSVSLLGLPLVHVATGALVNGQYRRGVEMGWIAVGDIALGVLFACGGIAVGAISLGGAALGLLPMGGFALGLFAVGGLGLGVVAVGVVAVGGAALAWYAAIGGLAVAHDYAIGGLALAPTVIGASSYPSTPLSSIPHAPFRWSDALLLLILIIAALLVVARVVQARRKG